MTTNGISHNQPVRIDRELNISSVIEKEQRFYFDLNSTENICIKGNTIEAEVKARFQYSFGDQTMVGDPKNSAKLIASEDTTRGATTAIGISLDSDKPTKIDTSTDIELIGVLPGCSQHTRKNALQEGPRRQ
jgi:hypothetical protein